jgi:hypothetical protein
MNTGGALDVGEEVDKVKASEQGRYCEMFRLRRKPRQQSATGQHRFVPAPDSRLGLAVGSEARGVDPGAAWIAVTNATQREQRCALPGCGKDRENPIHWPADQRG